MNKNGREAEYNSEITITYKEPTFKGTIPKRGKGRPSRALGTNPRSLGTNPRAQKGREEAK